MVRFGEEKMAKSVGNIRLLSDALDDYGRDALIMYFCGGHYRQPLAFSARQLEEATSRVARLREVARRLEDARSPTAMSGMRKRFFDALAADFNTTEALAALFEWVREANRRLAGGEVVGASDLHAMLDVLGLANLLAGEPPDDRARALAARREEARARRDFAAADRLRDELATLGWEVRDGPDGPRLVRG